ncbi:hypothetical protein GGS21DRAFT_502478, partial [Xylaria nigripes]
MPRVTESQSTTSLSDPPDFGMADFQYQLDDEIAGGHDEENVVKESIEAMFLEEQPMEENDTSDDNTSSISSDSSDDEDIEARVRPSNTTQTPASLATAQEESSGAQDAGPLTRKRSRPVKSPGASKLVIPIARSVRTRGTRNGYDLRRSHRTAAKLATEKMTDKKPEGAAPRPLASSRQKNTTVKASTDKVKKAAVKKAKTSTKEPEYEVEVILASRWNEKAGTDQYLVKWKGYVKRTWEPKSNLTHCAQALKRFRSD